MPKVRLNPAELKVESFDIDPVANSRGTVDAQELQWTGPNGYTCHPVMTCWQGGSCPAFSCVSQCDRNCFDDWSEAGCDFETAAGTCGYTCNVDPYQTCAQSCLQTCTCP